MKFAYPYVLWLLPGLLAGAYALWRHARRATRQKLGKFGPPDRLPLLLRSVDHRAKARKYGLVVAALGLLVAAAARPMLGPRSMEAEQSGVECFFILDVSKSMLVRDVPPNRLEAVKASLADWLRTRHGDRIGLILMAGDAFVQAPLTNDYTALREVLAQSGPSSVSRGGTNIAGAIQLATDALAKSGVKDKAVVLISDGDNLEGQAAEAAHTAYLRDQIRIFTVGVGSTEGGPVPDHQRGKRQDFTRPPKDFVKDEYGIRAHSRLDERTLRAIAAAAGGRYFRFTPEDDVWNALYAQSLRPLARSMEALDLKNYDDLFQLPLLAALALLAWEMAISTRLKQPLRSGPDVVLPARSGAAPAARMRTAPRPKARAEAFLLLLLLSLFALAGARARASAATASSRQAILEAEKLVADGKPADAARKLWAEAQENPDDPYLMFNYGIAAHAAGRFKDAINAFAEVSICRDEKLRSLALTHLGNAQYRLGKHLRDAKNTEGTIVAWERAVEYYDTAVKNQGDPNAAHNLTVAKDSLESLLMGAGSHALEQGDKTGDVHYRVRVYTSAFEKFEKAVALNPANSKAAEKLEKARALLAESLRRQAQGLRDKAAQADTTKDKGSQKERLQGQARQTYEKAAEIQPANADLAQEVAAFKRAVSDEFAGAAEAKIAEALNAQDNGTQDTKLLNKQKRLSAALGVVEKALAFDETNARAQQLKAQALGELEKAFAARADIMKARADETAARPGKADTAAGQYQTAMQDYQKALEINPDNTHAQQQLAQTQSSLAAQLAKAGQAEMGKAAKTAAAALSPQKKKDVPGPSDTRKLQEGIGHLEKAVQSFAQADALAPGQNNAAALQDQAGQQLAALRESLDKALGEENRHSSPEKGSSKAAGENTAAAAEGNEPEAGEEPADAAAGNPPASGGPPPLLSFSEIRATGSERQGQFKDKTSKEKIRDW